MQPSTCALSDPLDSLLMVHTRSFTS